MFAMDLQPLLPLLAVSFILFTWVECLPRDNQQPDQSGRNALKPSESTNIFSSPAAITLTMGEASKANCSGNKISWDKTQSTDPWVSLALTERLILHSNIWSADKTEVGSKSDITCRSFAAGALQWELNFQMISSEANKNQVKSYSHANWEGIPKRILDIKVFQSRWSWKLLNPSKDLCADVSYDIFLTENSSCRKQECSSLEIMIWLAAINGARPSGTKIGTIVVGRKYGFQVWKGYANNLPVISLIPTDPERRYTNFDVDFKKLLPKLAQFGVKQQSFVRSVGTGLEPFRGGGVLQSKYEIVLY